VTCTSLIEEFIPFSIYLSESAVSEAGIGVEANLPKIKGRR